MKQHLAIIASIIAFIALITWVDNESGVGPADIREHNFTNLKK